MNLNKSETVFSNFGCYFHIYSRTHRHTNIQIFFTMFSKSFQFLISQRNTANPALSLARNYAFKSDLKIKWNRPEKISCIDPRKTGDLEKYVKPDGDRVLFNYVKSDELKQADEMIKEMFTLGQNKRSEQVLIYKSELIDRVRRHGSDYGSCEVKSKFALLQHLRFLLINYRFSC